jgi:hypothetical protein
MATAVDPSPPAASGTTAIPGQTVAGEESGCSGLPSAHIVRLIDYSPDELRAIEEYLSAFKCYEHHRPMRASVSQVEYWYETRADVARINRNLRLMLDHMNSNGQISLSANTFVISKVATR